MNAFYNKSEFVRYLIILFLSLFLVSCGTQKKTKTSSPAETVKVQKEKEIVEVKPERREIEVITDPDMSAYETKEEPKEEFCARNTKMQGYRIQIYFSKDRKNWEPTEKAFKANHPSTDVLLKYSPPHYRILVGQYLTRNSAQVDLIKFKRDYPDAMIANWDIWCKNAK